MCLRHLTQYLCLTSLPPFNSPKTILKPSYPPLNCHSWPKPIFIYFCESALICYCLPTLLSFVSLSHTDSSIRFQKGNQEMKEGCSEEREGWTDTITQNWEPEDTLSERKVGGWTVRDKRQQLMRAGRGWGGKRGRSWRKYGMEVEEREQAKGEGWEVGVTKCPLSHPTGSSALLQQGCQMWLSQGVLPHEHRGRFNKARCKGMEGGRERKNGRWEKGRKEKKSNERILCDWDRIKQGRIVLQGSQNKSSS